MDINISPILESRQNGFLKLKQDIPDLFKHTNDVSGDLSPLMNKKSCCSHDINIDSGSSLESTPARRLLDSSSVFFESFNFSRVALRTLEDPFAVLVSSFVVVAAKEPS
ncbi:hypothetical protein ACJIZ3_018799 [Penstemon smallii]|uniref:Uncharacterized protein n=1 Tax=Penstemon smallii TaxID=265156 RepID=A0ABD3SZB9_9LAMI